MTISLATLIKINGKKISTVGAFFADQRQIGSAERAEIIGALIDTGSIWVRGSASNSLTIAVL